MRRSMFSFFLALVTFSSGIAMTRLMRAAFRPLAAKATCSIANVDQPLPVKRVEPPQERYQQKLRSLSPYDIEFFINADPQADIQDIWQRLGIDSKYNGDDKYNYVSNQGFFSKCHGCKAETYEYDLDGEYGSEVLLRIEDRLQEACRYLIFKYSGRGNDGEFIGHIDHDFGRYRMPQHRIIVSGGETYLVVQVQGGSGSGVSLYYDKIFQVRRSRVKEIVSYASEGHQSTTTDNPSREFAGRILNCQTKRNVTTVEVEFIVSYYNDFNTDEGRLMWTKKQKAVFRRRFKSKNAILDRSESNVTEDEIESVYTIDSLSDGEFLRYNSKELGLIASGRETKHKEWLRQFLNHTDKTSEAMALRYILGENHRAK